MGSQRDVHFSHGTPFFCQTRFCSNRYNPKARHGKEEQLFIRCEEEQIPRGLSEIREAPKYSSDDEEQLKPIEELAEEESGHTPPRTPLSQQIERELEPLGKLSVQDDDMAIAEEIKDALQQLIAQVGSGGGGGGGSKDIKINPPTTFKGKPDNTTRFIYQVKNYIEGNPGQFTDEKRRILFTASYMTEGGAEEWARAKLEEYRGTGKTYPSFNEFLKDLTEAFTPPNEKQRAYLLLQRTRLSDIPGQTIAGLNARYRTLIAKAGMEMTNPALTEMYKRTIKKEILKEILRKEKVPGTLEEWFKEALRLDNADRESEDIASGRKIHYGHQSSTTTERDPDAMDIDAVDTQTNGGGRPNTTPKTCYNCGGKGHIVRIP